MTVNSMIGPAGFTLPDAGEEFRDAFRILWRSGYCAAQGGRGRAAVRSRKETAILRSGAPKL